MKKITISTVKNKFDTNPERKEITLQEFEELIKTPRRTKESVEEYKTLNVKEKNEIKDVGGFIGGFFHGDGRKGEVTRTLLVFDVDDGDENTLKKLLSIPYVAYIYTTRNHTPQAPRYRVCIPSSEEIISERYEDVARVFASAFKINNDKHCFKTNQIMFWPSCSIDGAIEFFKTQSTELFDPYKFMSEECGLVLEKVETNKTKKEVAVETTSNESDIKKSEPMIISPLDKTGYIGDFCREFRISDVIELFLDDVYEKTEDANRYTYKDGSTSGGLVIYDDGVFAYSNHSSDPACIGRKLNAFDFVRIHKFGDDEDSFKKMIKFTKETLYPLDETIDKVSSKEISTRAGIISILKNNKDLKGIMFDSLRLNYYIDSDYPVPWRKSGGVWSDSDDASLRTYLEKEYDIDTPRNIKDAMLSYIVGEKSIHPIAEYFNSLEWDGISRLDTLLIEYLGAADNEYTRAVTRKTIVAAVARTYKPGIKFDTTLVLTGPQGIGKSTIFSKLAREWFTDSMLISDMGDKKAPEKLLGVLIAEISELAGRRKSEEEIVKGFLSRQTDRFRAAYATKATDYPRSCIIVATANEDNFLKDTSGNRRYWPVSVTGNTKLKSWDLTDEEIDQIWAEAVFRYKAGEKLYLEGEVSKYASELQIKAIETDSEKEGIIEAFLDMKLPNNWGNLNNCERNNYFRKFLSNSLLPIEIGTVTRTEVCTSEIFYECFGWDDNYKRSKSDSLVVIRILQKLGWKKAGKKRVELYGPQEVYRKN